MKEILITSSVLILVLLALRWMFRSRITRRAQYALWALVLVRLLVPFSLPGADFSVLTAAQPVEQQLAHRAEAVGDRVVFTWEPTEVETAPAQSPAQAVPDAPAGGTNLDAQTPDTDSYTYLVMEQQTLTLGTLLPYLWYAGMAVTGLWFLFCNLQFWQKLRKARKPYTAHGCKYPVYLVESGLPSPCLFGLFRPAIYLTPEAVSSPERTRHVIAHESAHARHGDPLWSLLRCVCLSVYWFDPLVWIAAAVSKTDCELACDESAMASLGQAERIAYGRTLLALIPVRRGPSNPLLTATTMTADKRHLKERIVRIAENRQTRTAALFAVIALAAAVCVVTFTGAASEKNRPLTGDELAYFNEEFFNSDAEGMHIHNQFLTSLYEQPEDIDLYELFYCGTGISETMTEVERVLVGNFDLDGSLICPTDKLSLDAIDTVLLENTGLTLNKTSKTGMEHFQYLPQYESYYHSHGDTNYFHSVRITAGERQGDTIRLYYPDDFSRYPDYDWLCVTLAVQEDGSLWFVSNLPSEKPAIATVYPEGDPALTLSLEDAVPCVPVPVNVTRRQDDCAERGYGILITTQGGEEYSFRPYRSTDGNVYAAVIYDEAAGRDGMAAWDAGCFFTYPEGSNVDYLTMDSFSLFGYTGVVVSYEDYVTGSAETGGYQSDCHDYYAVSDDGTITFLFRAYGVAVPQARDLDGDGTDELTAATGFTAQIFFQRDGAIYEADIAAMLSNAWPEASYLNFNGWDFSRRCLNLWGDVPFVGHEDAGTTGTAWRRVYFDGENLLAYKDSTTYTDHVANGIDVPGEVLDAARNKVRAYMEQFQGMAWNEDYTAIDASPEWDDWRITSLELVDEAPAYPELGIKVYGLGFELHTPIPERVMTAGGTYIDEDGWVGGMYVESPYLVFHTMTSSGPTLLENHIPSDVGNTSDSPVFAACLAQTLLENGLLTPSRIRDMDLYYLFYNNQTRFLNLMGTYDTQEQEHTMQVLVACAVAMADTSDGDLLELGLQNLAWNSTALTAEGRAAYELLLSEVERRTAVDAAAAQTAVQSDYSPSDVAFYDQPLMLDQDPMTYDERLAWCQGGWQETEEPVFFQPETYMEGDGCIAYWGSQVGASPMGQAYKQLLLRFADGTEASLPLPQAQEVGTAPPDTMLFLDGTLIYVVSFEDQLLSQNGQTLLHLAGSYRYTVNLTDKTVSLTVVQ